MRDCRKIEGSCRLLPALGALLAAALLGLVAAGSAHAQGDQLGFLERFGQFAPSAAVATAESPDGTSLYSADSKSNSITAFSRNLTTGELTYLDTYRSIQATGGAGVGGSDNMRTPSDIVVSPDGKNVYLTSSGGRHVVVFSRNLTTGALTFVEAVVDNSHQNPQGIAVSAGGENVYVVADGSDSIVAYDRDPGDGTLAKIDSEFDGQSVVSGLEGPTSVAVAPDGASVFVTALPSGSNGSVAVFDRANDGQLTFNESEDQTTVPTLHGAQQGVASFDDMNFYVASKFSSAGAGGGSVTVFDRDAVGGGITFSSAEENGVGGNMLFDADDVAASVDNQNIYVAALAGTGAFLSVYTRDGNGDLTLVEVEGDSGADPTVTADGKDVYVVDAVKNGGGFSTARGSSIGRWSRDAGDAGRLSFTESLPERPQDLIGEAKDVTVSPDGEHVYATATGDGSAVFVLERNAVGGLSFVEAERDGTDDGGAGGAVEGIRDAEEVLVSPDGEFVYVAGAVDDAVALFDRNAVTGELDYLSCVGEAAPCTDLGGTVTNFASPRALAQTTTGSHLFVTARLSNTVTSFVRDTGTGALTLVRDQESDGAGGADELEGPDGLDVSPDDKHLYVAAHDDDAVTKFAIDGNGNLSAPQAVVDGPVLDPPELRGPVDVAVSPDGGSVYAVAEPSRTIVALDRDAGSGAITFNEQEQEGVDDPADPGGEVDGLRTPTSVAVSPDSKHVYVTGSAGPSTPDPDEALVLFDRDAANGKLSFSKVALDHDPGIDGLHGARSLALSPDGDFAYVASFLDDAVAAFDLTAPDTQIDSGPAEGSTDDDGSVSFTFSSQTAASFSCSLDGAPFGACTSPKAYTGLADGAHDFEVRAVDAGGNTDQTPAERGFNVSTATPDTEAPRLVVRGKKKQKSKKKVIVKAKCKNEACDLRAKGIIKIPVGKGKSKKNKRLAPTAETAKKKKFKLKTKRKKNVEANKLVRLKLKVKGKKAKRKLKKALRKGRTSKAKIKVFATDAAGNTTKKKFKVKVKKRKRKR